MTSVIPVLVALEAELPYDLPAPYVKIITGVGKIKATIAATEAVLKYNPHTIINMGTAGSLDPALRLGVHEVGKVGQRDMDATPLGWKVGQTPFSGELWLELKSSDISLTTGDNFVTSRPALSSTLVDMEAYGIAMVCNKYKVIFDCYKYVSDFADEESTTDWEQNCADGADEFMKILSNRSEIKDGALSRHHIQDSEDRRRAMKKDRRKREGEMINKIKQPKKMYNGRSSLDIDTVTGPVNRGKDWYSK